MKNKIHNWDYWIGYRTFSDKPLFECTNEKVNIKYLKPSVHYWYADPMIAKINGEIYVFMEAFHRIKGKGVICVSKLNHGKLTRPKKVLEEPFHLSFPNVFEYDNRYYMIPETINDKSIRIYEMQENPYHWTLINRIDTNEKGYVDTAVSIDEKNKFFLFLSEENKDNALYDKLCIQLLTKFPNGKEIENPIYESEFGLTNRNAGTICEISGKKYRFSQLNLKDAYGKAVIINEIDAFSEYKYEEHKIGEITCDMFNFPKGLSPEGTHTYNVIDDLEVVDFVGNVTVFSTYVFAFRNLVRNKILKKAFGFLNHGKKQ